MENLSLWRLVCFCLIAIFHWDSASCTITDLKYVARSLCNAQDRIDNACFVQVSARSPLECLTRCSSTSSCDSVLIFSPDTSCYLSTTCNFVPVCSVVDPDYSYYVNEDNLITTEPAPVTTEPAPVTTEPAPVTTEPASVTTEPAPVTTELITTEPPTTAVPEGCQHGGIEVSEDVCDCTVTAGYIGTKCEIKATACSQLDDEGYPDGTYPVYYDLFGDGSLFFQTYCTLSFFSSSVDIMRNSGSFDTDLTWNDYVNGFHLGPNDFFVGLETLHQYTSDGGSHYVTTKVTFNSTQVTGYSYKTHSSFVVQSAASGYRYTCGSTTGFGTQVTTSGVSTSFFDIDDMLSSQTNTPFSTKDNDQDGSAGQNCAQLAQAGWWFNGCSPFLSNPFGWNYNAKPGATTDSHFHVPGLDMSQTAVMSAFDYMSISVD